MISTRSLIGSPIEHHFENIFKHLDLMVKILAWIHFSKKIKLIRFFAAGLHTIFVLVKPLFLVQNLDTKHF